MQFSQSTDCSCSNLKSPTRVAKTNRSWACTMSPSIGNLWQIGPTIWVSLAIRSRRREGDLRMTAKCYKMHRLCSTCKISVMQPPQIFTRLMCLHKRPWTSPTLTRTGTKVYVTACSSVEAPSMVSILSWWTKGPRICDSLPSFKKGVTYTVTNLALTGSSSAPPARTSTVKVAQIRSAVMHLNWVQMTTASYHWLARRSSSASGFVNTSLQNLTSIAFGIRKGRCTVKIWRRWIKLSKLSSASSKRSMSRTRISTLQICRDNSSQSDQRTRCIDSWPTKC